MEIQIKTAPFGRGMGWLTDGLEYFTRNPFGWIAAVVVVFIVMVVIGLIPLGSLLVYLLYSVFAGGFMLGCRAHNNDGKFEFQHAFAGFESPYLKRLVVFGIYYALANLLILVLVAVGMLLIVGDMEFIRQMRTMQPEQWLQFQMELSLLLLLMAALFLPLVMASLFAPALIVTTDKSVMQSMLLSFRACLYNIPAFTLYGIVVLVLGILALIPFALGYLILVPVLTGSVYAAYMDCFSLPAPMQAETDSVET